MNYETILLSKKESVAILTINRPDKMNCMNALFEQEISEAVDEISKDDEIRVVVFTAAGNIFCAGADFDFLKELSKQTASRSTHWLSSPIGLATISLAELEKPIIAAVNGAAVGGGLSMIAACDIRIASEKAKFILGFNEIGLSWDNGLTYTLPRIIGLAKALEWMLTGETLGAKEAAQIGLVNKVVPHEDLMKVTMEMAKHIANRAPIATQLTKMAIHKGLSNDLRGQFYVESFTASRCENTADYNEGITAFLEKRPPRFKGK